MIALALEIWRADGVNVLITSCGTYSSRRPEDEPLRQQINVIKPNIGINLIQTWAVFYAQGQIEPMGKRAIHTFMINPNGYFLVDFGRPAFEHDPLTVIARGTLATLINDYARLIMVNVEPDLLEVVVSEDVGGHLQLICFLPQALMREQRVRTMRAGHGSGLLLIIHGSRERVSRCLPSTCIRKPIGRVRAARGPARKSLEPN
ncbi:hypothetical protein PCASD_25854 [Puccinia coronata f. sp. avenae]|uniref:Uncharacterized protein n=1 Tax=Puccinia coronata f. sp. avenae TaxID=200324 RepID=A0A2N5TP31_9BASI|nr:hypothetical protein PCASD_25854 [Puccinia coronata f. sp. avenae]